MTIVYRGMKVCSVEEMKRIDEEASRRYGIDHLLLMEDAGTAVYTVVLREIGVWGKRFCVVAGTGNNGGDALVAARRLFSTGADTRVYVVGDLSRATELMKRNLETVRAMGVPIEYIDSDEGLEKAREGMRSCDVFIVGLIGIGLRGEVTGYRRSLIEYINSLGRTVVSVDIPSGIGGDNGRVYGAAVRSHYTVTFGLPKYGNILYPGYHYSGRLYVSRLSYPPQLLDSGEIKTELNYPVRVPERLRWGHKGLFGKFLAVGGARYYYGAPYYTAYSFLKAGGGYSRLAAPRSVVPYIACRNSEIVFIPLEETEEGTISMANLERVLSIVRDYDIDIVAVGPGASLNRETQDFIRELVSLLDRPVIIDGDGITAVSRDPGVVKKRRAATVLTPHLGEFTRLTGLRTEEVLEDPIGVLRKTVSELGSVVVLKGAHSLIGCPDGRVYINMTGNPGMAKAGTGDVLTGTIAAMYGIGVRDICDATRTGVLVHGLAGDLAADKIGEDGVTPDDIIESLPEAVRILRERPEYIIERYMPKIV